MITSAPRAIGKDRPSVVIALSRTTGRILTGFAYAVLGLDAVRSPGARVGQAAGTLATLRKVLPLPHDDALIVRGNAAVQTAAGATLALGRAPRLAAAALAGSLVPTTLAGHAFWQLEDPASRKLQRVQFLKNMAMLGGLLFAVSHATRPGNGGDHNG